LIPSRGVIDGGGSRSPLRGERLFLAERRDRRLLGGDVRLETRDRALDLCLLSSPTGVPFLLLRVDVDRFRRDRELKLAEMVGGALVLTAVEEAREWRQSRRSSAAW
jgi:hypothetical protein